MKIDIKDKKYPEKLKKIKKPPEQLYIIGNLSLLNTAGIAIIGSRNCSIYGEKMAKKFSKELSQYGLTIISGMAKGIDSYAHESAIQTGGNTIAILPSGFNNIYPKENKKLYNKILDNNGLIITEYQIDVKADSKKFLERNRIVSGLSIGTLVIEGGKRSGTSVTANITKNEGKFVFCIPSSLENSKGITPNNLIKKGAILVTETSDIVKKYPELKLNKKVEKQRKIEENIDEQFKEIYKVISKDKPIHINEISKKLKIGIQEINYKLTILELEEKIISLPGQNYIKR